MPDTTAFIYWLCQILTPKVVRQMDSAEIREWQAFYNAERPNA